MPYRIQILGLLFLFSHLSLSAQVDSGYVTSKMPHTFYRVWGSGPPLVFINGGPGYDSRGYQMYAEALSANRQVILYDQRGTGKSTHKKYIGSKVHMHQLVNELERLRIHLKIEKWDVMGHSFGGRLAMYYAAGHSESINRMVLSATPKLSEKPTDDLQQFRAPPFAQLTLAEKQLFATLEQEKSSADPDPELISKLQVALKGRFYVSKPENYARAAVWFLNHYQPRSSDYILMTSANNQDRVHRKMKKFQPPVLIIHGIADFLNISHPLSNHELFANAQLEILPESGHMMLLDQPEAYIDKIKDFLQSPLAEH